MAIVHVTFETLADLLGFQNSKITNVWTSPGNLNTLGMSIELVDFAENAPVKLTYATTAYLSSIEALGSAEVSVLDQDAGDLEFEQDQIIDDYIEQNGDANRIRGSLGNGIIHTSAFQNYILYRIRQGAAPHEMAALVSLLVS